MIATERDRETARVKGGVRVPPIWPGARVHAFRHWTGETELLTWCGQPANLADGAEQTRAFINCRDCAQASLTAIREG